jgi:Chaperone of endosialidase
MKRLLMTCCCCLLVNYLFAQPEPGNNVGIGITNPTLARLQVNGVSGSGTTSAIFGGDGTGVSFQRNAPVIGFNQYRDNITGNGKYMANGFAATQTLDPTTGYMYFDMFPSGVANASIPAGTRSLTISNTGNIGIQAGAINATLFAFKAGNPSGAASFGGTSYTSYFCFGPQEHTYIRGGLNNSRVFINDVNTGNILIGAGNSFVGINTPIATATLDIRQVGGKGLIIINPDRNFDNWELHTGYYQDAPESDLKLYNNELLVGHFAAVQGWYEYTTSDRRIKTNITPLPSVLDKLALLQPKEYEMKDFNENHEKTFGFMAQDINELYPTFVRIQNIRVDSINRIPDLYSLNYDGFDIIAIKALQEQYEQLKTLEKKNMALLKRLDELDKKPDKE